MRYKLSFVREIMDELKAIEDNLRDYYEGRAMTRAECEALSEYHTDYVNSRLKNYFNIMDDIASVHIGYTHGVVITVALGD